MAFERYIQKHGKRLGPYYYENVRGPDGKVKTVYLGANPANHPKHRIRKPLFFLILVLVLILILGSSLFFLQNKSYLIKKVKFQQADFEVDQILLKVLIRSGEFIEKQVRVMNIGGEQSSINADVAGFDIVNIDSRAFAIKPGQTKILNLKFSSFIADQNIEQQPGVYVGKLILKSEKVVKEVPMIVEIETKNVLFDMNLNPVAIERKVLQGSDTTIEVRLFNLQSIESANVDVEYFVKDMNGNTIQTESETVVAKTQASFFKTISIPKNLKPGPYVFAAQSKFGNSIGTASYLFEVIGPETEASFAQFCKNNILCLGLSLTTILLLFAVMAYFYFFIGAYLYEKVTGIVTLPKKKETEEAEFEKEEIIEEPEESVFERIKNSISEWKYSLKRKKSEKERAEREKVLQRQADDRKAKFEKFRNTLNNAKEAAAKNNASKAKNLYVEARKLYVGLGYEEKKEVYDELNHLYTQIKRIKEKTIREEESRKNKKLRKNEELRRQKELEAKQIEKEKQRKILEKERLWKERKEKSRAFLHKLGFFKTPEEKKQIELQKERESQEKLKKQKIEKQIAEEERKAAEEQKKLKEQEKLRLQEEKKKQKEIERQKAEEERKKQVERLEKKEPEEKKISLFRRLFKKKEPEFKLKEVEEKPKQEIKDKEKKPSMFAGLLGRIQQPSAEKPGIFERLFKKRAAGEEKGKEQKQKPESEFEELEQAIRGLGLFKKIEKEVGVKEKPKGEVNGKEKKLPKAGKPSKNDNKSKIISLKEKTSGKSKEFEKFHIFLNNAKKAAAKNNASKAKKLYVEARKLYVGLGYEEKKDVYEELMKMYKKLSK